MLRLRLFLPGKVFAILHAKIINSSVLEASFIQLKPLLIRGQQSSVRLSSPPVSFSRLSSVSFLDHIRPFGNSLSSSWFLGPGFYWSQKGGMAFDLVEVIDISATRRKKRSRINTPRKNVQMHRAVFN